MPPWRKKKSQCLLSAFSKFVFKVIETGWNFNELVNEIPNHKAPILESRPKLGVWSGVSKMVYILVNFNSFKILLLCLKFVKES